MSEIIENDFSEKSRNKKSLFVLFFDGSCVVNKKHGTPTTYQMGVCALNYKDDILTVYLRRPGLLIGTGGQTIDALSEYLDCKIKVVEVDLTK